MYNGITVKLLLMRVCHYNPDEVNEQLFTSMKRYDMIRIGTLFSVPSRFDRDTRPVGDQNVSHQGRDSKKTLRIDALSVFFCIVSNTRSLPLLSM
jgi:hypothetical protein